MNGRIFYRRPRIDLDSLYVAFFKNLDSTPQEWVIFVICKVIFSLGQRTRGIEDMGNSAIRIRSIFSFEADRNLRTFICKRGFFKKWTHFLMSIYCMNKLIKN